MKITKAVPLFLCAMIVAFLLLPIGSAQADKEATPFDYAIITEDKKYIFVMLVPDEEIMRSWDFLGEEPTFYRTRVFQTEISYEQYREADRETFFLRNKYPCSGLYKNDGSIIPIWTVDWYGSVYLLGDGEHLIRRGPWHRTWESGKDTQFDGLAVAFYKNGIEAAKYSVDDLVKDKEAIKYSVSHYEWRIKQEFDKVTGLLYIETVDHLAYTFDIQKVSETIHERHTDCKPNYRFSTPEPRKQVLELAISFVAFLVIVGGCPIR